MERFIQEGEDRVARVAQAVRVVRVVRAGQEVLAERGVVRRERVGRPHRLPVMPTIIAPRPNTALWIWARFYAPTPVTLPSQVVDQAISVIPPKPFACEIPTAAASRTAHRIRFASMMALNTVPPTAPEKVAAHEAINAHKTKVFAIKRKAPRTPLSIPPDLPPDAPQASIRIRIAMTFGHGFLARQDGSPSDNVKDPVAPALFDEKYTVCHLRRGIQQTWSSGFQGSWT